MRITVELSDEQAERLRSLAERLEVLPEELARAWVTELLGQPDAAFQTAAEHVLHKNEELYRQLAR